MLIRTILLSAVLMPLLNHPFPATGDSLSSDGVSLYTPHTRISVPPGESISYSIDVKNNSGELKKINLTVGAMPKGWAYSLKADGFNIQQLSILPGEKRTISLKVDVPMEVNKGNHRFRVVADGYAELPLVVNVSEQGTYKTEFTSDQPNMEGNSKSTFTFSTKIKNQTAEKQLYSLRADVARGWQVTFKPDYKQATSVEVEPNATKNMSIEIKSPEYVEAGTYKIPVSAVTTSTSANLDLEVVITGTYEMELTTPTGVLSTNITAGDDRRIELLIKNTGSAVLKDIKLTASKPANWDVVFEPQKIDILEAGKNAEVIATLKADKKAIAGDYVTTLTASTPEVSAKESFRISVKTPMLWGWVGVLIILAALGSVYYMFRKYGRR